LANDLEADVNPVKVVSELKATNWILERWAISVGDGLYGIQWEDIPQSRVPPLNDQMAIVVDQLILRSGDKTKRLIGYWYRTNLPKTEIARKIGVDRDTIYARWNSALHYFRGRFLDSPLSDLRLIARTDFADLPTPAQTAPTKIVAFDPTLRDHPDANMKNCLRDMAGAA
jgi:hypothetical protein